MVRILHVSDIHFGVNDPRGEQVRLTDALIEAVQRDELNPDVIIFSGDLAFSGTREQFKTGEDWLRRLCAVAPLAELFVVPGNHDVERTKVEAPNLLHAAGSKEIGFNEWKRSIKDQIPGHLDEFFNWIRSASGVLPLKAAWTTPYGFHYTKEDLKRPLHIIGLNSALLSCSDSDEKNLAIDVLVANQGLHRSQGKPGVVVAVAHHPFDHLVDWNKAELEKILAQGSGADLYLHGHLHTQLGAAKSDISGKSLATLAAGAAYQGSNWPQQFACYEIGERDLQTTVYTYSADSGEWVTDNRLAGRLLLDLAPLPASTGADAKARSNYEPPSERVTLEVHRIDSRKIEAGSQRSAVIQATHVFASIDHEVSRHRIAARYIESEVARYFRDDPLLTKVCYAVKHRVKQRDRIKEKMHQKGTSDAREIVDICGFRLITFFQGDIPDVVEHLLKVIELEDHPKSPFTKRCKVEIDINTSRTESDPLSVSGAVQEVAARSILKPKVDVKSRPTNYSSVHMIVSAPAKEDDTDVKEMFLEIQIRSAWEDIWGEIDHRLRYGSERGGPGVSSGQHLNVFKALIDGVVQYVDVIRLQSKDDNPTSPNAIKAGKTIAAPETQQERLRGLSQEIQDRVSKAFELWKQADASRQRGGNPGLLRQAADAFASILEEFKGQPADNAKLADELEYVAATERAYLLMYTGDGFDLAQSAELYKNILSRRPNDATALFRLGIVRSFQKQFMESERLLRDALVVIESGEDDRLDISHWTYDIVRLHLGLTRWRIFKDNGQSQYLTSAIGLARDVVAKQADPANLMRAVNDLVYYAYEERQIPERKQELLVGDVEFRQWTDKLEQELAVQERSYEYQDTLMSALVESKRHEEALAAAVKLRDMLEQVVVLKAPDLKPGKKGSYAWTVALNRFLDDDQKECLAHAQDVISAGKS